MSGDLAFACRCGEVAGVLRGVGPHTGLRYVCHCDDCQAYAHHLDRADLLDARGGTYAYQTNASRLVMTRGLERLAALRVANQPMRPAIRWYATCCTTPLFASYDTAQRSFFVLLLGGIDPKMRDALLGPPMGVVWRKYAAADISDRRDANLLAIIWRMVSRETNARLNGDWRNTPLFHAATGNPVAPPRQITAAERTAAETRLEEWKASRRAGSISG